MNNLYWSTPIEPVIPEMFEVVYEGPPRPLTPLEARLQAMWRGERVSGQELAKDEGGAQPEGERVLRHRGR